MEFIYVLLALAVAVGAYFLFFKKSEPALPPREEAAPPKPKSERAQAPAAKAASVKTKAAAAAPAEDVEEAEAEARRRTFAPYQVTGGLMSAANSNALFMHCLPAHRGEEVASDVIDSAASVVFDQAENRLHTQKALLQLLIGK